MTTRKVYLLCEYGNPENNLYKIDEFLAPYENDECVYIQIYDGFEAIPKDEVYESYEDALMDAYENGFHVID